MKHFTIMFVSCCLSMSLVCAFEFPKLDVMIGKLMNPSVIDKETVRAPAVPGKTQTETIVFDSVSKANSICANIGQIHPFQSFWMIFSCLFGQIGRSNRSYPAHEQSWSQCERGCCLQRTRSQTCYGHCWSTRRQRYQIEFRVFQTKTSQIRSFLIVNEVWNKNQKNNN